MNTFLVQTFFLGTLGLLSPGTISAQYGVRHPLTGGNPILRSISPGFSLEVLVDDANDFKAGWASAFHPAEGKAPPEPDYDKYNDALIADDEKVFDKELAKIDAYTAWQSMYSASRLQDGDTTTCWAAAGQGLGEVVIAKVDAMQDVVIYTGFQKSLDLFKKNSRPRKVMVYVLEPTYQEAGPSSVSYLRVKVVAAREVELKDAYGPQPLPIPSYWPTTIKAHPDGSPLEDPIYQSFVALKILSVYPGSKYEDTCISEISN